jgi:hypothetical protein
MSEECKEYVSYYLSYSSVRVRVWWGKPDDRIAAPSQNSKITPTSIRDPVPPTKTPARLKLEPPQL